MKRKQWVFISIIGIFLFSLLLYSAYLRFNFLLNNELSLSLSPSFSSLNVSNADPTYLEYTAKVEHFPECETRCDYSLRDDANNLLSASSFIVGDENKHLQFTLSPQGRGEGQSIYTLSLACQNIKSLLCLTEGESLWTNSLITVNYYRPLSELHLVKRLEEQLNTAFSLLASGDSLHMNTVEVSSQLPRSLNLEVETEKLVSDLEQIEQMWNMSDTLGVNARLTPLFLSQFKEYHDLQEYHSRRAKDFFAARNASITLLNSLDTHQLQSLLLTLREDWKDQQKTDILTSHLSLLLSYDDIIAKNSSVDDTILLREINQTVNELSYFVNESEEDKKKMEFATAYSASLLAVKRSTPLLIPPPLCTVLLNTIAEIQKENLPLSSSQDDLTQALAYEAFVLLQGTNSSLTHGITVQAPLQEVNASLLPTAFINSSFLTDVSSTLCFETVPVITNATDRFFLRPLLTPLSESAVVQTPPHTVVLPDPLCRGGTCCVEGCSPPILFLHGHSINEAASPLSSMSSFAPLQKYLEDYGFLNAGELSLSPSGVPGDWKRSNISLTVRASYYYISTFDFGVYSVSTQKSERIENYALRLHELVKALQLRTGGSKVIIVAHSMGGLVAREYMSLFGDQAIEKLILINTPNHGVGKKISDYCTKVGALKECEDLSMNSVFLERLNAKPIHRIPIISIASKGCRTGTTDGDGIVTLESAQLLGAENLEYRGKCTDSLGTNLHTEVLNPESHPEFAELLVTLLRE